MKHRLLLLILGLSCLAGCKDADPKVSYAYRSGTIFITIDGKEVAFRYDSDLLSKHQSWDLHSPLPLSPSDYIESAAKTASEITEISDWYSIGYQLRRPSPEEAFIVTVFLQNRKHKELLAHIPITISGTPLPHEIKE